MVFFIGLIGIGFPFVLSVMGGLCASGEKKGKNTGGFFLLGLSAGVMLSTSVWSLLLPAIDQGNATFLGGVIPISLGFLSGFFVLLLLDFIMEGLSKRVKRQTGEEKKRGLGLLVFAMALHNIPEGITLGLAFSLAREIGATGGGIGTAILLSLGIGIQNFPESAAIVLSLRERRVGRWKAFYYSFLASIVEPVAAVLAVFLACYITPFLPFLLAYAAGTMIHVTVEELIPEVQKKACGHKGTLGILCGFLLMMLLDIYL